MIPARESVHTSTCSSAQLNHKHFHLGGDREFVDNKGVRNLVEASKTKAGRPCLSPDTAQDPKCTNVQVVYLIIDSYFPSKLSPSICLGRSDHVLYLSNTKHKSRWFTTVGPARRTKEQTTHSRATGQSTKHSVSTFGRTSSSKGTRKLKPKE